MAIQTRSTVDQWERGSQVGAITPITTRAALIPAVEKRRVIESISFDNRTGGTITVTLYIAKSGTAATAGIAFYFASYNTVTGGAVPVANLPINLEPGDTLVALASATALTYFVSYKDEV